VTEQVAAPAVECRGIHKRFGAIRANDGIDLMVSRGSVHGIIGENGAGKSTLMGLLYGHFPPDAGEIRIHGRPARFRSPKGAIAAGISMVHQHFVLVETFTVVENCFSAANKARCCAEPHGRCAKSSRVSPPISTWHSTPMRSPAPYRSGCASASKS
jgi:ABC-type uncharacterized transport system ATPase subunit